MTTEDDSRDGASAASDADLPPDESGHSGIPGKAFDNPEDDEDQRDSIFGLRPSSRGLAGQGKTEAPAGAFSTSSGSDGEGVPFVDSDSPDPFSVAGDLPFSLPEDGERCSLGPLPDGPESGETPSSGFAEENEVFFPDNGDFLAGEAGCAPGFAEGEEPRWLGVRFRKTGQVYFIPDRVHAVRRGTKVLVRQENGQILGEVDSIIEGDRLLPGQDITSPGKCIAGVATAQDIARHTENSILADEAEAFCKTCIRQRELDMKLVDVEVLHDRSKIIFYFTAPSRIDFRELVKDLVRNYRTRIELRQIGVRHESQMIGGLGNCGMVCCCHRYLRKFAPVTIKMAKEQNLFLNPSKLSGMCGRLLCCLSFEQGNYEEFNRRCPKIGKKYVTESKGTVRILRANMFSQTICVHADSGEEMEFSLEEWENMQPRRAEPHHHDAGRAADQTGQGEDGGKQGRHKKIPGQEDGGRDAVGHDAAGHDAAGNGFYFHDEEALAALAAAERQDSPPPQRKGAGRQRPGKRRQRE